MIVCTTLAGSLHTSGGLAGPASPSPSYRASERGSGATTPERGRSRRAAAMRSDAFRQKALHSPDHNGFDFTHMMSPGHHSAPVTTAATAAALAALAANAPSQLPISGAALEGNALANAAGIAAALMGALSPQAWGKQESRSRRPTRPRSVSARERSDDRRCVCLVTS